MTPEANDVATQVAKAAPAVAGAVASSLTLNQWVAIATGIYIVIQCLYLIRKWWREEVSWARKVEIFDLEREVEDAARERRFRRRS